MEMVAINVEVPKEVNDWLVDQAEEKMTSKATVVRQILAGHIEESESEEKSNKVRR